MNINLVDVIIIGGLLFSLLAGMHKGFIASGLSIIGFIAACILSVNIFPIIAERIMSNESLMGYIGQYLDADQLFSTATRSMSSMMVSDVRGDQAFTTLLSELKVPDIIKDQFQKNISTGAFSGLGLNQVGEYLSQTIITALINVATFAVTFLVVYAAILLFINLLNAVFHFPLLRHLDGLLGGVFGLARGYVVILFILAALPLLESVVQLDMIEELIQQSQFAKYFSSGQILDQIIAAVRGATGGA